MMVILASMIASQALGEYKVMLGGALNVGVTPSPVAIRRLSAHAQRAQCAERIAPEEKVLGDE
jgi:hypothetical protein